MNGKTIYLAMAISFAVMGMSGIVPLLILSAIYFYAFFTYDANERKKEENRKSWLQNREREDKEKARIAKIRYDEGMAEIEKAKQERLQKIQKQKAEETERAIKKQQFSYVYVLSNDSMPGILKIGYTNNYPELRAKEISNTTGVPTPFKVLKEYSFATLTRAQNEEKRLHSLFKNHRVSANREFFRLSLNQVDKEIRDNIKTGVFNSATNISRPPKKEPIILSESPKLKNRTVYTQFEKSRVNPDKQTKLKERKPTTNKPADSGVYAYDPGPIATYSFKCKYCGKDFYSTKPMNISTECPHCFKR